MQHEDHVEGDDYASSDNDDYEDDDLNLHGQMQDSAPSIPAKNDAPRTHDDLVGKDVILYALLRADVPVAKGTILSTNPSTLLGGMSLGRQFCEVVVNVVLKRDADLPRPYAIVQTMGDAYKMPIAWPYRRLKVIKNASTSSHDIFSWYFRNC